MIRMPNEMYKMIRLLLLCIAVLLILTPLAQASIEAEELASIQKTSKAFTAIANKVMPAVVFINVEKTIEAGQSVSPFEFNNPFDLFNDDFFNPHYYSSFVEIMYLYF